jgi:radical SAM superfamily enzyme YgiQ (UPF0313 family)
MEELVELSEIYHIHHLAFLSDTFTINNKWVHALCDSIIANNLQMHWMCSTRTDTVTPAMLRKMKKAGCRLISFGIESGAQEILENSKKMLHLKDSLNAVAWCKEEGIESLGYFIFGLPGETEETIEKTIDFALALNPTYANFHIATPFPGTEFYEEARKNKWLIHENWDDFEEMGGTALQYEHLKTKKLREYQKKATMKFYLRPLSIWNQLKKVHSLAQLRHRVSAGLGSILLK